MEFDVEATEIGRETEWDKKADDYKATGKFEVALSTPLGQPKVVSMTLVVDDPQAFLIGARYIVAVEPGRLR